MPVIKHAEAATMAREAIVLDLGDLERQAAVLRERAESEAARIVEAGRAERERLIEGASERGYAEGYAKGLEAGRSAGVQQGREEALAEAKGELAGIDVGWGEAVGGFSAEREAMVREARRDVLRLAVAIAEKLTRRVFEVDGEQVSRTLEAALEMVLDPTRIAVSVHPDDAAIAEVVLPGFVARFERTPDVEVREEVGLARGSCVIHTGKGRLDATLGKQLERVVDALLGEIGGGAVLGGAPDIEEGAEIGRGDEEAGGA